MPTSPDRTSPDRTTTETWLNQPWRAARPHLATVLAIVAITTGAAAVATSRQPTRYSATTTFVVNTTVGRTDTETLIRTLAALLRSPALGADVQQAASLDLSPRAIAHRVSVSRPPGSGVLNVKVTDTSRRRALRIVDELPRAFTRRIDQQLRPGAAETDTSFALGSWDSDVATTSTIPPPISRNTILGFGLGLALALLAVALRETRSPYLRSSAQAYAAFELPVIAALPPLDHSPRAAWNVIDTIQGLLAAAPDAGWPTHPQALLVTGPEASDARASMALAVAVAIAVAGAHVVLIDADVERATLSAALGAKKDKGLREFLMRQSTARDIVRPVDPAKLPSWLGISGAVKGSLDLVPAGTAKCDAGALGSIRVAALLASLRASAVIVIHGPRVPGASPVTRLLESSDAVLAVAVDGLTRAPAAASTGNVLRSLGGPPAASILLETNRFEVLAAPSRPAVSPVAPIAPAPTPAGDAGDGTGAGDVEALPWP